MHGALFVVSASALVTPGPRVPVRSVVSRRAVRAFCSATSRNVLVTGAARGIGAAISKRFAADGDRVLLHYRSDAGAAEAVRASLPDGEHLCLHADLSETGAADALLADAVAAAGRVDVLVVNHGIYEETPVETTSAQAWRESFERVLRVNLAAPAALAFAFACPFPFAVGGSGTSFFRFLLLW